MSFHDRIIRQSRHKDPASYLQKAIEGKAVDKEQVLSSEDLRFEFMMNALRLNEGFQAALFTQHTGLPLSACTAAIEKAQELGLIALGANTLRPSAKGRRFLNELLVLFL